MGAADTCDDRYYPGIGSTDDMQQTILALGALLIITMLAVQQQRASFINLEGVYIREIENAAADFAKKRSEEIISGAAFDETRTGSTDLDVDTSTLTGIGALGPDATENDIASFDDIDDYHGYTEQVVHVLSADSFRFDVSYTVEYVNPSSPSSTPTGPTLAKELTIMVLSQDSVGTRAAQYSQSETIIVSDNL